MDYGVRVITDEIGDNLQKHAFRCLELGRAISLTPWWRVFMKRALTEEERRENIKLKGLRELYSRRMDEEAALNRKKYREEYRDDPPISEDEQAAEEMSEGLRERDIPDCDRRGLEWLFGTWEPHSLETCRIVFERLDLDFAGLSGTDATFVSRKGERLVLKPYGLCEWRRSRPDGGEDVGSNCNWRDPSGNLAGIICDSGLDYSGKLVRLYSGGGHPHPPSPATEERERKRKERRKRYVEWLDGSDWPYSSPPKVPVAPEMVCRPETPEKDVSNLRAILAAWGPGNAECLFTILLAWGVELVGTTEEEAVFIHKDGSQTSLKRSRWELRDTSGRAWLGGVTSDIMLEGFDIGWKHLKPLE